MAGASGCNPRTNGEDLLLNARHPFCRFESLTSELPDGVQGALLEAGRVAGRFAATPGATRYVERQTGDGYLVRKVSSGVVMALVLFGVGALAAALALTLGQRRPAARWAERLAQSLAREVEALRALGRAGDGFTKELVARFEEPLELATKRAQRIMERAVGLSRRDGAPTALAHLESLHGQLEGLLGLVERAHLQVLTWQERQHAEERTALQKQIDEVLSSLTSALKEASE